jgi:ERCC4-type nuclease
MKLIIDVREAALYNKSFLINESYSSSNVEIETKSLPLGDALIETGEGKPVWIVERKSLTDLLASLIDGRYEEQSYRLQNDVDHPRHNVVYIIEGMYSQLTKPEHKRVILSTMASLSYFKGFSVFRTCSVQETAELLVYFADKIDRKFQKGVLPYVYRWNSDRTEESGECLTFPPKSLDNTLEKTRGDVNEVIPPYCSVVKKVKKDNITSDNIGEILLSQIPGISSVTAVAIMTECNGSLKTLIHLLESDQTKIDTIMIGGGEKKKRISKNLVEKLKSFLLK